MRLEVKNYQGVPLRKLTGRRFRFVARFMRLDTHVTRDDVEEFTALLQQVTFADNEPFRDHVWLTLGCTPLLFEALPQRTWVEFNARLHMYERKPARYGLHAPKDIIYWAKGRA